LKKGRKKNTVRKKSPLAAPGIGPRKFLQSGVFGGDGKDKGKEGDKGGILLEACLEGHGGGAK